MHSSKKDFPTWHKKKTVLHEDKIRPFFREHEIWFCTLGLNIGFEQDGRGDGYMRPVIILKKFNNEIFWGIPLTKTQKNGLYYYPFKFGDQISTAIISQIKLIDSKRLNYKIGIINEEDLKEIKNRLKNLLK